MVTDRHLYDFSNYPKNHPLYDTSNKKVIGKFKDELGGAIMEEFVGLRPKCYSIMYNGEEKKAIAGVKQFVQKRFLRHRDFRTTLTTLTPILVTQNNIVSKKHVVKTVNQTKIGLNALDTKRYILEDGISTLAYGHYKI